MIRKNRPKLVQAMLAAIGGVPIAARALRLRFFRALRPLDRLDDRRAVALGRPAGGRPGDQAGAKREKIVNAEPEPQSGHRRWSRAMACTSFGRSFLLFRF